MKNLNEILESKEKKIKNIEAIRNMDESKIDNILLGSNNKQNTIIRSIEQNVIIDFETLEIRAQYLFKRRVIYNKFLLS